MSSKINLGVVALGIMVFGIAFATGGVTYSYMNDHEQVGGQPSMNFTTGSWCDFKHGTWLEYDDGDCFGLIDIWHFEPKKLSLNERYEMGIMSASEVAGDFRVYANVSDMEDVNTTAEAFELRREGTGDGVSPIYPKCSDDTGVCELVFDKSDVLGLVPGDGNYSMVLTGEWKDGVRLLGRQHLEVEGQNSQRVSQIQRRERAEKTVPAPSDGPGVLTVVSQGNITVGNETVVNVRLDGEPVEGVPVAVNGNGVGETDVNGSVSFNASNASAELSATVESDGWRLTQRRLVGGDDDNSTGIDASNASEAALGEVSEGNWSVDTVEHLDDEGVYDVSLSGDGGAFANVTLDAGSGRTTVVNEAVPLGKPTAKSGNATSSNATNATNVTPSANVTDYTVSNTTVDLNATVSVNATVENDGNASASTNVTLYKDASVNETRNVTVAASSTLNVVFEVGFDTATNHTVGVNRLAPTTVTVEDADRSGTVGTQVAKNTTSADGNTTDQDRNTTDT